MSEGRSEADALQIKAIINQAFDVWDAKRNASAEIKSRSGWQGSIPAWAALLVSVLGFAMLTGGTNQKVNDNTRSVRELEVSDQRQDESVSQLRAELASIQAKLDYIIRNGK